MKPRIAYLHHAEDFYLSKQQYDAELAKDQRTAQSYLQFQEVLPNQIVVDRDKYEKLEKDLADAQRSAKLHAQAYLQQVEVRIKIEKELERIVNSMNRGC